MARGSFVIISGLVRLSRDPQIYERQNGRSTIVVPIVWDTYRRKPEGGYDSLGNFLDLKAYDKYQVERLAQLHKGADLGFAARLGSEQYTNKQTGQSQQRFVGTMLHFTFPYGRYTKGEEGDEELVSLSDIRREFDAQELTNQGVTDDSECPF
jgi:single-stranded DNA-binding protein